MSALHDNTMNADGRVARVVERGTDREVMRWDGAIYVHGGAAG